MASVETRAARCRHSIFDATIVVPHQAGNRRTLPAVSFKTRAAQELLHLVASERLVEFGHETIGLGAAEAKTSKLII